MTTGLTGSSAGAAGVPTPSGPGGSGAVPSPAPSPTWDAEGWLDAWDALHPGEVVERNSPDAEDVMDAGWELCSMIQYNRRGELTREGLDNVAGVYGATSGDDLIAAAERHLCPR